MAAAPDGRIITGAASSCRRSASAAGPKPSDASLRRGVAGDLDAPGVASQAMWPGLGGIRGFRCAATLVLSELGRRNSRELDSAA